MIPEIRASSVAVTSTSSNSGSCGRQRAHRGLDLRSTNAWRMLSICTIMLQRRRDFELVFKNKVAPRIKARMMEKGSVLIGYQPLGTKVNFSGVCSPSCHRAGGH
ncbi:hypothetical protein INR49_004854 [Caranx melampygus]|nr:hypothetical protein INR49_004854 [Caranx melampygus]